MLTWIQQTGPMGLLALLAFAVIGVAVGYAWFSARERGPFLILTILALIPLLIGGVGTLIGHRILEATLTATPGSASPLEEATQRRRANSPLWLGGGLSAALLLAAGLGLVLKRSDAETLL